MNELVALSGDLDGKELREWKARSRRFVRCDNTQDNNEMNEFIQSDTGKQWSIGRVSWERIFGGCNG